ncbi:dihydrofolate reductase family protein [uncultured Microbacterium sp.]|uniref:dihydrofolate reductase family protein n=1 Tax=uncultured Microbacterium sp. TaxID=191216 RepID=UPI0028D1DBD1|nr:dihydrofolate reductase family protein [uncultured Microbacterium sp.]
MGRVIVVQYITLDGVVEDPDGSDGTPDGGWAMRYGPEAIAGDKFGLGGIMESGVLLFGRRTWDHFSELWPPRESEFARRMNAAEKAVATHRDLPEGVWTNSRLIPHPLEEWARDTTRTRDIAVIGSESVISQLRAADLVDEYRLITFPVVLGRGERLFQDAAHLELVSSEVVGAGTLSTYRVA